jgi:hypothetical protein
MIPSGLGALLLALALVPGWYYLRLMSRLRARTRLAGISELLEIVSVGALTTGTAALIVVIVPHRLHPFTVDIDRWAAEGSAYLRASARNGGWTVATVVILALLIATLLFLAQRRWNPSEFRLDGNVWVQALGSRPSGTLPWVGLHLQDGRFVEGILHSYTVEDIGDDRDVALRRPIRFTDRDYGEPTVLEVDRLIVPRGQIDYISVIHFPEAPKLAKGQKGAQTGQNPSPPS